MSRLPIRLSSNGQREFLNTLTANGIEFAKRLPSLDVMVWAAGETIEIIAAVGSLPFATIAGVLVAWLRGRASRSVTIQTKQNAFVQITGYSVEEVASLLREASSLNVIQTTKDDPE